MIASLSVIVGSAKVACILPCIILLIEAILLFILVIISSTLISLEGNSWNISVIALLYFCPTVVGSPSFIIVLSSSGVKSTSTSFISPLASSTYSIFFIRFKSSKLS